MSWRSGKGIVFPNKETRTGILWTDWPTWNDAPPAAFIMGWHDPATNMPQGLWWKDWWGGICFINDMEVEQHRPSYHFLPFKSYDGHPSWKWDGNVTKPTLSPSILINDRYYKDPKRREVWHGYLKAGVFASC